MRLPSILTLAGALALAACSGEPGSPCPPDETYFQTRVWEPVLRGNCTTCHSPTGLAASSDFVLDPGGSMRSNLEAARKVAMMTEDGEPLIVRRPTGGNHPGGTVVEPGSPEHRALVEFAGRVRGTEGACDGPEVACQAGDPGPRLVRRLSRSEYDQTLRDVLGVEASYAPALVADVVVNGFDNNARALVVSPLLAEQLRAAAEEVAATVAARPDLACTGDQPACARGFLEGKAARIFRRPLTAAEIERWLVVYQAGRDTAATGVPAHRSGMELMIGGLLQSPAFLYRTELGEPGADGRFALTSYEIASELSYFLWGGPPDDELWAAAGRDELRDPAAIATQARRLLASPRARTAIDRFTSQWLAIEQLATVARDPMAYPDLTPAVRAAMAEEARRLVAEVVQGGGTFADLLAADHTWANAELARYYGLPAPGAVDASGFGKVAAGMRGGLLATGAVLTTHAKPASSSPIHRGKLVRERFLCQPLPPPPPGLNAQPPAVDPTKTTRERFAMHVAEPACAGCHDLMDPIGFAFEHFDGAGRFRATEHGLPIDDSGEVKGSQASNGAFTGIDGLSQHLAASDEVQACFAREWLRWAYGVEDDPSLACLVDEVGAAFVGSGGSVEELIVALTQTSHFRTRKGVPDGNGSDDGDDGSGGSGGSGGDGGGSGGGGGGDGGGGSGGGGDTTTPGVMATVTKTDQWSNGYCARVDVRNTTTAPVTWRVTVTIEGTIYNHWNATVSQTGAQATFAGAAHNATLAAGAATDLGFCANL